MATDVKVKCPVCCVEETIPFTYIHQEELVLGNQPMRVLCSKCRQKLRDTLKKEDFLNVVVGCASGRQCAIGSARQVCCALTCEISGERR